MGHAGAAGGLGFSLLNVDDAAIDMGRDGGGVLVIGPGFVVNTALHGSVGLDQRFEGFADIPVGGGGNGFGGVQQGDRDERHENFAPLEGLFSNFNILIGNRRGVQRCGLAFVEMGFAKITAITRTVDGFLASFGAAGGTNIAADSGTGAAGFTDLANGARHLLSIRRDELKLMRTNLFIKIVVEHDQKEQPERLGAELCRQLERNYIVRKAELASFAPVED